MNLPSLLSFALIAASCSATTADDDLTDPVVFNRLFSEQYCAEVDSCGAPRGWDYESCTRFFLLTPSQAAQLRVLLDEGRATYSARAASTCLDAIAADTCPTAPTISGNPHGLEGLDLGLDDAGACAGVIDYVNPPLTPDEAKLGHRAM